jgi:hypothetical protein
MFVIKLNVIDRGMFIACKNPLAGEGVSAVNRPVTPLIFKSRYRN